MALPSRGCSQGCSSGDGRAPRAAAPSLRRARRPPPRRRRSRRSARASARNLVTELRHAPCFTGARPLRDTERASDPSSRSTPAPSSESVASSAREERRADRCVEDAVRRMRSEGGVVGVPGRTGRAVEVPARKLANGGHDDGGQPSDRLIDRARPAAGGRLPAGRSSSRWRLRLRSRSRLRLRSRSRLRLRSRSRLRLRSRSRLRLRSRSRSRSGPR